MTDGHVLDELGAYVLGALDPADRRAVEAHLNACARCRGELVDLSPLPGLLDRLSSDEARRDLVTPVERTGADVLAVAADEARRLRRAVRRWRLATVAASVAVVVTAVVAAAPWEGDGPSAVAAPLTPVTEIAAATEGTVRAIAWEWGTTVELEITGLPARDTYVVWTVAPDGSRQRAGAWGPTASGGARVRGASPQARDRIVTVEVTDGDGAVLLAADLADARAGAGTG